MAYSVVKFILFLIILSLPFQILGVVAHYVFVKSNARRARTALVFVPGATFFATFLAMFLWCYFHPGMLMLGAGAVNLFVLIIMLAGTGLQLGIGVVVRSILYRRKGSAGM